MPVDDPVFSGKKSWAEDIFLKLARALIADINTHPIRAKYLLYIYVHHSERVMEIA